MRPCFVCGTSWVEKDASQLKDGVRGFIALVLAASQPG